MDRHYTYYKDFYFDNPEQDTLKFGSEIEQRLVDLAQQMGYSQQLLVNRINSINTTQGHSTAPLKAPMSFWTNHLAGRVTFPHLLWYWKGMLSSVIRHVAKKIKIKLLPKDAPPDEKTNKSDEV